MNYANHDETDLLHFYVFKYFFYIFFTDFKIFKDSPAKYCLNNKEKLQKKALENCQSLSKEEKDKKQKHGHEQYKNLPEDEKKK